MKNTIFNKEKYSDNKIPVYQDLILELNILKSRLNVLSDEKMEYERQINKFNSDYMLRFGKLIEEILKLRVILFNEKSDLQYQDAEQNLEELGRIYIQQLQNITELLTESEQLELKNAYRKASRLCHPDRLAESDKASGEKIFKALNEAYRQQKLVIVKDILLKLESEKKFSSDLDLTNNKDILQQKIKLILKHIAILELEIKCLQENEIYRRIQSITNMDSYFAELECELQAELKSLKEKEELL